jgi:hypothetical protein
MELIPTTAKKRSVVDPRIRIQLFISMRIHTDPDPGQTLKARKLNFSVKQKYT